MEGPMFFVDHKEVNLSYLFLLGGNGKMKYTKQKSWRPFWNATDRVTSGDKARRKGDIARGGIWLHPVDRNGTGMNKPTNGIVFIVWAILTFTSPGFSGLVHRYSFDDNADDSIGSAHGTLVNATGTAGYSNGTVNLSNPNTPTSSASNINYIDLPNAIISALGENATFEAWVTWNGPVNYWQRIFDFGTGDSGENFSYGGANSTYIFMTPLGGGGRYRVGYRRGAELGSVEERVIDGTSVLSAGRELHVALVWDWTDQQTRIYLDGQLLDTGQPHFRLTDLPDVNNWLGRSQWDDPVFNGIYNEFRIYDLALDDAQILRSYSAGPDSPPTDFIDLPNNPFPGNGQTDILTNTTLSWTSSESPLITGRQIYLGTDKTAVQNATTTSTGIFRGTVGPSVQSFSPGALNLQTTYYWKIVEITGDGKTFSGAVWSFRTIDPMVEAISPTDGAGNVSAKLPLTLQWKSSGSVARYNVYFGINPRQLQAKILYYQGTSFVVTSLQPDTTYFWRIDSVIPPSSEVLTGPDWSFKTIEQSIACLPGDLDGNCVVDLSDLVIFSLQWLDNELCGGFDCADFNRDGNVNLADFGVTAANWNASHDPLVVINEIHYHPDKNTEPVEFIELYNAGGVAVDLSGWILEDAVEYSFPAGTYIPSGDFLVIAQDASAFLKKFGFPPAGTFDGTLRNEGETITLRDSSRKKIDEVSYRSEFPWSIAADGEGASLELIHPTIDNDLAGSWRASYYRDGQDPETAFGTPTPGKENGCRNVQVPPQIRQVEHEAIGAPPAQDKHQPTSSQNIQITVKVTDPDGVKSVTLLYQIVAPGSYIPSRLPLTTTELMANPFQPRPKNPAFEDPANWVSMPMKDDGIAPDIIANDGIYTAMISPQVNRTLFRYRITAEDLLGNSVRVPYADDPSLNFACYIYNGVPDYVVSKDSVHAEGAGHVYPASVLTSLPVYTLITRDVDMADCMVFQGQYQIPHDGSLYNETARRTENWEGAFVYEGKVYDHVGYRLRGGNGRYYDGKRAMNFEFNRGRYFEARDIYGDKFPRKWESLVVGKMRGNHQIGRYGLNEVLNMRLWNQFDVPAPELYWFHFRVVDGVEEAPATDYGQYEGDFWGMYIALEDYNAGFIEHQELEKGNLYKLSSRTWDGWRMLRYQGPDAIEVIDNVAPGDFENIRWNLKTASTAEFITKYLDYREWSRYHTVAEAIRHYDVFSGGDRSSENLKNMSWYFAPDSTAQNPYGKLWFMPFDTDDTWGPYWNFGVDHAKAAVFEVNHYNQPVVNPLSASKLPLRIEYRNIMREFRDLHWQPDVINGMIDELAQVIEPFVPAERDRWRLEPSSSSHDDGTLEACVADMKRFAWQGGSNWPGNGVNSWPGSGTNLDNLSGAEGDSTSIPHTPTIQYTGTEHYPSNQLRFTTSAFSDPQGNGTFGAMEWRIGEYEPYVPPGGQPTEVVWIDQGDMWRYFRGTQEPSSQTGYWRKLDFNDDPQESNWFEGSAPIGYDRDLTMGTRLTNKYCTLYFRLKFEVTAAELAAVDSLQFETLYDDGFTIWINEKPVLRGNVPEEEIPYNGDLRNYPGYTYRENNTYQVDSITDPENYLVVGTNIIAVQIVNYDYTSSSDLFLDLKMAGVPDPSFPLSTLKIKERKFEIEPVWKSDELTTFSDTIQIPPYALRAGRTYRARCRMKDNTGRWSHWSAPFEFTTTDPIATGVIEDLRLTELMYNPPRPAGSSYTADDFEFIEFKNIGDETLDLSTVQITDGVTFDFGSAESKIKTLGPGEFVLVVRNEDAFESRYGTAALWRVAGEYGGGLNNNSERIRVADAWYGTVVTCTYSDGWGWPKEADGGGHSLVPLEASYARQYLGSLNYGAMWRASAYLNGSPGQDDPAVPASVVLNELRAHTDFSDPHYPGYDSNDWIELYNPTGDTISFNDWYLSDEVSNLKKWHIGNRTLPSGQWISFDEIHDFHSPLTSGFGLDKAGELVVLSCLPGNGQDRVVDCVRFKGQENETVSGNGQFVSLGRYPDGGHRWFSMAASRDAANSAPTNPVMIREFMYHPKEVHDKEYIEIYNPTDQAIFLMSEGGAWRLDGQVDYVFPDHTRIASHQRIVVVGFDPAISGDLAWFQNRYTAGPLIAGVDIFGPWDGDLANDTGRIAIEKPLAPDLPDMDIPWVVVDEVIYYDDIPWPFEADGQGKALRRITPDPTVSSNDPAAWQAVMPLE